MIPNYDVDLFEVNSDTRGFILDESVLDEDIITTASGAWQNIVGDLTSASLSMSVGIEGRVLTRPEQSNFTFTTRTTPPTNLYNRSLEVYYNSRLMFTGTIRDTQTSVFLDNGKSMKSYSITAVDGLDSWANTLLVDFTAPQETTEERLDFSIVDAYESARGLSPGSTGVFADFETALAPRSMPAITTAVTETALSLIQDVSDAQFARTYMDSENGLNVVFDPASVDVSLTKALPMLRLSDNPDDNLPSYTTLDFAENLDNVVTGISVAAKSDDTIKASRRLAATNVSEESFSIDVLPITGDLTAWANQFPLQGATASLPTSLTTEFVEDFLTAGRWDSPLHPTTLIAVTLEGGTYTVGVASINYSFTPEKALVGLGLVPDWTFNYGTSDSPSSPRNFIVTVKSSTTVTMAWNTPSYTEGFTGYELRRATGQTPPTKTSGTLVATLGTGAVSKQDSGRTGNTYYSYSLFATTADPAIYSSPAQLTVKTS